jgi:transposase
VVTDMDYSRDDASSYQRVELITGTVKRRQWSASEKARILAESAEPMANVSEVARRNGVNRGLLNIWRRQARRAPCGDGPFVQLRIAEKGEEKERTAARKVSAPRAGVRIEIAIGGATVRVAEGVDERTLERVLAAVRSTR